VAAVASILKAVSKSELQICTFARISGGTYAICLLHRCIRMRQVIRIR
jgi:hypothetical protein